MLSRVGSSFANYAAFKSNMINPDISEETPPESTLTENAEEKKKEYNVSSLIQLKELTNPQACKTNILEGSNKAIISSINVRLGDKIPGLVRELRDNRNIEKVVFICTNEKQKAIAQTVKREIEKEQEENPGQNKVEMELALSTEIKSSKRKKKQVETKTEKTLNKFA